MSNVPETPPREEYKFAKYNVQIEVPTYTQDVYDAQLTDDDWTKEETDYLVDLVQDYSQKWPVIIDRYEYTPSAEGAEASPRTMEDLKTRFYAVSSKMLAHRIPIDSMNRQQYAMYECMRDFDGEQEATRKRLVEQHLHKTETEVNEETALLAELQRIMISQQKLEAERKELRERLDYPEATGMAGAQYMSSQGLTRLFQELLAADRLKKDRRLKDPPGTATTAQATSAGQRDSIAGASAVSQKGGRGARDSLGSAAIDELRGGAGGAGARPLSPRSSAKYYVSTHDKISSGVGFASDKLVKARIAKSAIQTERIAGVLNYLRIPEIISLPTQAVVEAFEGVMAKVNELLEMRKLAEKEDAEAKVLAAARDLRLGKTAAPAAAAAAPVASAVKADDAKPGKDAPLAVDTTQTAVETKPQGEAEDGTAVGTPGGAANRRQKRSASVMSSTSNNAASASVKRRK